MIVSESMPPKLDKRPPPPLVVRNFRSLCVTSARCASLPLVVRHFHSLCVTSARCASLPLVVRHFRSLCVASARCASLPIVVRHFRPSYVTSGRRASLPLAASQVRSTFRSSWMRYQQSRGRNWRRRPSGTLSVSISEMTYHQVRRARKKAIIYSSILHIIL